MDRTAGATSVRCAGEQMRSFWSAADGLAASMGSSRNVPGARSEHSWRIFDLGSRFYAWFTAQAAWRLSCAQVASRLPVDGRVRALDLGCGPGVSTFELARARPGSLIVGLDRSAQMLEQARRRLASAGLASQKVHWLQADGAHLPVASGSVDAVTGHSFLYLVADRPLVLAECLRVLCPGGRFITMEPSDQGASWRSVLAVSRDPRFLISVALWRPFSRLHGRFSRASLRATLERAGFVNCTAEATLGGLGVLAWADKSTGGRV